jgi:hypothetical protein
MSPKVEIEEDGLDMFVIVNSVTIARRGHPGTAEAGTWVSLPGGPSRAARMTIGLRSGSSAAANRSFTEPGRTAPYPQNRPPGGFVFPTNRLSRRKKPRSPRPACRPFMAATMPQRRVRNAEEATRPASENYPATRC